MPSWNKHSSSHPAWSHAVQIPMQLSIFTLEDCMRAARQTNTHNDPICTGSLEQGKALSSKDHSMGGTYSIKNLKRIPKSSILQRPSFLHIFGEHRTALQPLLGFITECNTHCDAAINLPSFKSTAHTATGKGRWTLQLITDVPIKSVSALNVTRVVTNSVN